MKNNTNFFQTSGEPEHGWMWSGYPNKTLGGTEVEINEKNYNLSPGIQKVLVKTSNNTAKSINDMDKVVFGDLLQKFKYFNLKPTKRRISGRDRYMKNNLDRDVRRILNLDTKLDSRGIQKIVMPADMKDIYTRHEILLGLKLSGHTNTLTEASNLIDEIYKRGEIQNKQQDRNALNKLSNLCMEQPSKILGQFAHNARPKIEEHMLILKEKSTHEDHLSQPLQTIN